MKNRIISCPRQLQGVCINGLTNKVRERQQVVLTKIHVPPVNKSQHYCGGIHQRSTNQELVYVILKHHLISVVPYGSVYNQFRCTHNINIHRFPPTYTPVNQSITTITHTFIIHHRSGNFHVTKFSCFKFSCKNIFVVGTTHKIFFTVCRF